MRSPLAATREKGMITAFLPSNIAYEDISAHRRHREGTQNAHDEKTRNADDTIYGC